MAILDSLDAAKGWRKWLVSTWSIFECLLLTGIFYGWSSLVFVFRDEGIYGELCEGGSYNESLFENKYSTKLTTFAVSVRFCSGCGELTF